MHQFSLIILLTFLAQYFTFTQSADNCPFSFPLILGGKQDRTELYGLDIFEEKIVFSGISYDKELTGYDQRRGYVALIKPVSTYLWKKVFNLDSALIESKFSKEGNKILAISEGDSPILFILSVFDGSISTAINLGNSLSARLFESMIQDVYFSESYPIIISAQRFSNSNYALIYAYSQSSFRVFFSQRKGYSASICKSLSKEGYYFIGGSLDKYPVIQVTAGDVNDSQFFRFDLETTPSMDATISRIKTAIYDEKEQLFGTISIDRQSQSSKLIIFRIFYTASSGNFDPSVSIIQLAENICRQVLETSINSIDEFAMLLTDSNFQVYYLVINFDNKILKAQKTSVYISNSIQITSAVLSSRYGAIIAGHTRGIFSSQQRQPGGGSMDYLFSQRSAFVSSISLEFWDCKGVDPSNIRINFQEKTLIVRSLTSAQTSFTNSQILTAVSVSTLPQEFGKTYLQQLYCSTSSIQESDILTTKSQHHLNLRLKSIECSFYTEYVAEIDQTQSQTVTGITLNYNQNDNKLDLFSSESNNGKFSIIKVYGQLPSSDKLLLMEVNITWIDPKCLEKIRVVSNYYSTFLSHPFYIKFQEIDDYYQICKSFMREKLVDVPRQCNQLQDEIGNFQLSCFITKESGKQQYFYFKYEIKVKSQTMIFDYTIEILPRELFCQMQKDNFSFKKIFNMTEQKVNLRTQQSNNLFMSAEIANQFQANFTLQILFGSADAFSKYHNGQILSSPNQKSQIGNYQIALLVNHKFCTEIYTDFITLKVQADVDGTSNVQPGSQNQNQNLNESTSNYVNKQFEKYFEENIKKGKDIKNALPKIQARIQGISQDGKVAIMFSKKMNTSFISQDQDLKDQFNVGLSIYVKGSFGKIRVNYTMVSFSDKILILQLLLNLVSDQISQSKVNMNLSDFFQQTSIDVFFSKGNLFYSSDFQERLPDYHSITATMPAQITKQEEQLVNSFIGVSSYSAATVFGANFVVSMLMSASFQQIWAMIESFQYISHVPLISLNFPGLISYFFSMLNEILSFNLVPVDMLSNLIFDQESDFTDGPFNLFFEAMGYSSISLIQNLGLLFYTSCIVYFLFILTILTNRIKSLQKLKRYFGGRPILQFYLESSLEYYICSQITLQKLSLDSSFQLVGFIISILLSVTQIIVPIWVLYISISLYKGRVDKKESLSMHEELHMESKGSILYILNLLTRKQLYALSLFIFGEYPYFQFLSLLGLSFATTLMILLFNPYRNRKLKFTILLNEMGFQAFMYSFLVHFGSSDLDEDLKTKLSIFQISFCILIIAANCSCIALDVIMKLLPLTKMIIRKIQQLLKKRAQIYQLEISQVASISIVKEENLHVQKRSRLHSFFQKNTDNGNFESYIFSDQSSVNVSALKLKEDEITEIKIRNHQCERNNYSLSSLSSLQLSNDFSLFSRIDSNNQKNKKQSLRNLTRKEMKYSKDQSKDQSDAQNILKFFKKVQGNGMNGFQPFYIPKQHQFEVDDENCNLESQ